MNWSKSGRIIQTGEMLTLDSNPYSGKKVLVTGHTGFKGAWLVYILNAMGAQVKGYALEPDDNQILYNTLDIESRCKSVYGDIRDVKRMTAEIQNFQPDFVFHLAAQPLVKEAYKNPILTLETNMMGSAYLLEGLKDLSGKCTVVMATTDKVYRNNEGMNFFVENDALGGDDPYSASKASADILIQSYRSSYFNPKYYHQHLKAIAIARSGNVIGGGDWSIDRIVPDFLRSIQNKEAIILRNPAAVRPWLHVLDNLYGYLLLGAKLNEDPLQFSTEFNFGPDLDDCISVNELCSQMIKTVGKGRIELANSKTKEKEHQILRLHSSKAISELGWKPQLMVDETIKWTMEWYNTPTEEAIQVTQQQIESYFNSMTL